MSNLPISGLPTGLPVSDTDLLADTQAIGTGPVQITASGLKTYIGNGLTLTNAVINSPFSINGVNYSWPSSNGPTGSVITNDGAGNLTWSLNPLAGTVTSVNVSGGLTGLTTVNGPITSVGTIDLAGVLNVAHGGTGGTDRSSAMRNILPPISSTTAAYALFNDGIGTYYWAYAGGGSAPGVLNISTGTTGLLANGSSGNVNGNVLLSGVLNTTNGGTGLSAIGTAGQVLTVNSGATALQWATPASDIEVGVTIITSGTSGAIPFNNAGVYGEDATQLFWNNANNQLLVGGNTAVGLNKFQLINSDALIYGLTVGRGSGSGATNTVVGAGALATNITGTRNTAIGASALAANRADFNTAIGYNAMAATTTGNGNVAVGDGALSVNTIGNSNIAVGSSALSSNTIGSYNSAIGFNCLAANTTGVNNTAVGNRALASCAVYSNNTAVGRDALFLNTLGSDNASFGYNAARETATNNNAVFGAHALEFNTVGGNNTIIGCNAGDAINSSNNTLVGRYTGFGAPVNGTGSGFVVLSDGLGNVRFATNASGALSFDGASYGAAGQVLQSNGNAAVPTWVTPSSGIEVGVTTITSGTAGSIPYNNGTVYSEDNANLFWDDTAKQLSIGTNTTATTPADIQLQVIKDALIAGMTVGLGPAQGATNTAVGKSVLAANTVDGNLTGIGVEALTSNTTGIRNTAVGYQAAYSNTIGNQNTAFGAYALYTNDADNNTGLGFQACSANTSGTDNTAVGSNTLAAASADIANTAVGSNVLNAFTGGNNNTAVGAFAAQVLQGGTDNTFIGANASGITNTNVDNNTGVGSRSLENTGSNNNTAVGVESLQTNISNTGGNTAVGYRSLRNCQGARNTSIGRLAMSFDTVTGAENTALGISALGSLTSGNYNTALGKSAGFSITSGSSNTIIGAYDGTAAPIFSSGSNYVVLSDGDGNVPVFWEGLTRNQICNGPVVTQGYTVAGLAAIASPIVGMRVHVTDANAPTFLTPLVGGGSIRCPAFYNGTNWVAG